MKYESKTARRLELHNGTVKVSQHKNLRDKVNWRPAEVSWMTYGGTTDQDAREFAAAVLRAAAIAYAWNLDGKRVESAKSPGLAGVVDAVSVHKHGGCSVNVKWDNGTFSGCFDPYDLVEVK